MFPSYRRHPWFSTELLTIQTMAPSFTVKRFSWKMFSQIFFACTFRFHDDDHDELPWWRRSLSGHNFIIRNPASLRKWHFEQILKMNISASVLCLAYKLVPLGMSIIHKKKLSNRTIWAPIHAHRGDLSQHSTSNYMLSLLWPTALTGVGSILASRKT